MLLVTISVLICNKLADRCRGVRGTITGGNREEYAMYEAQSGWHWDEDMLLPVAEINELLLVLLRDRAVSSDPAPRLIGDLRPLWGAADHAALQRLARCP